MTRPLHIEEAHKFTLADNIPIISLLYRDTEAVSMIFKTFN